MRLMSKRDSMVAALLASCLLILSHAVDAATLDVRACDHPCRRMRDKRIEMKHDETDFQSDMGLLKGSLRHHASQERIERLRYRIEEDWHQIVMDRSDARASRRSQSMDIANERFKHNGEIHPSS
jgi:hypothetical protein